MSIPFPRLCLSLFFLVLAWITFYYPLPGASKLLLYSRSFLPPYFHPIKPEHIQSALGLIHLTAGVTLCTSQKPGKYAAIVTNT